MWGRGLCRLWMRLTMGRVTGCFVRVCRRRLMMRRLLIVPLSILVRLGGDRGGRPRFLIRRVWLSVLCRIRLLVCFTLVRLLCRLCRCLRLRLRCRFTRWLTLRTVVRRRIVRWGRGLFVLCFLMGCLTLTLMRLIRLLIVRFPWLRLRSGWVLWLCLGRTLIWRVVFVCRGPFTCV